MTRSSCSVWSAPHRREPAPPGPSVAERGASWAYIIPAQFGTERGKRLYFPTAVFEQALAAELLAVVGPVRAHGSRIGVAHGAHPVPPLPLGPDCPIGLQRGIGGVVHAIMLLGLIASLPSGMLQVPVVSHLMGPPGMVLVVRERDQHRTAQSQTVRCADQRQ